MRERMRETRKEKERYRQREGQKERMGGRDWRSI